MSIVATRLIQALAERGIDQSMLARRLGVTQGTISKIAQGRTHNSRHLPESPTNWACN
jgi:transcriptional regulator with XRE-family HTH domain